MIVLRITLGELRKAPQQKKVEIKKRLFYLSANLYKLVEVQIFIPQYDCGDHSRTIRAAGSPLWINDG